MANKKRLINAVDWIKRAPAAQLARMRDALAGMPGGPGPITQAVRGLECSVTVDRAYALIPGPSDGGVPSWHLLKMKLYRGVVIHVDKSDQNLRPVHLQAIEDDILRDA